MRELSGQLYRAKKRQVLLMMVRLLDKLEARLNAAKDKLLNKLDHELELERAKLEQEP